ncbi:MAG TPA: hypothetical protein VN634_08660 [Candidatus Limnocylindrales bacterium]|nr:hypothetical protein [Candidatus Limnocylindrales bacterium]
MPIVRNVLWVLVGVVVGQAICLAGGRDTLALTANDTISFASLTVFVMLLVTSRERWPSAPAAL